VIMEQILIPIEKDLEVFEVLIDDFLETIKQDKVRSNFQAFFKARGKYLRPSLLMLATGATVGDRSCFDEKLYKLGLIIELLHSASLVHDDIVDNDTMRRGEKTINQIFGNKIAVLAGDTLFSYAFKEVTLNYDVNYSVPITQLSLDMCMAELEQANEVDSLASYMRVIQGKTAEFMAVSCELGARYGGGSEEEIMRMRNIGLNIGMTYQMVDDLIDGDPNALRFITDEDIQMSYQKTMTLLEELKPSEYRSSMMMLLKFIVSMNDQCNVQVTQSAYQV